ncbi:MAG: hypothetical protein WC924_01565 [Candidatus Gracilibacteria bacterium]
MTDQELYEKALMYGRNALLWRQKFMGLLPEVEKRRLYEKKGFGSVFEFAFKLAGLSEEQVRRVLNLEKRFVGLPALKELLVEGEVSVNKLARVASIATPENEQELAEAVKILPNRAIETLVRDENRIKTKSVPRGHFVHVHNLELNEEVLEKLHELKEKGLDLNELLLDLLKKREEKIAEEKEAISEELEPAKSRYIPARVMKIVRKEYGTKCSIQTCKKPAEQVHHTQIYELSRRHDPHYLAPLCKEHHVIAHAINVKVQEKRKEALIQLVQETT